VDGRIEQYVLPRLAVVNSLKSTQRSVNNRKAPHKVPHMTSFEQVHVPHLHFHLKGRLTTLLFFV
jgi:hypothetical protein